MFRGIFTKKGLLVVILSPLLTVLIIKGIESVWGDGKPFYMVNITQNLSRSLPYKYFFSTSFVSPRKGDFISFIPRPTQDIPQGVAPFVKIVLGTAGDLIVVKGHRVYVGGKILFAKPFSKKGRALEVIKSMVIPRGKVFVYTPHPDSYDSRYLEIGLIDESQVLGKAWGFGKL